MSTFRASERKSVPLHRASRHAWIDIRDVCELILILLAKNYAGIATLFANVRNNLYCVHNNVALLSHYLEALTTCDTYRKLVSSPNIRPWGPENPLRRKISEVHRL
jgi:hypothetical protein